MEQLGSSLHRAKETYDIVPDLLWLPLGAQLHKITNADEFKTDSSAVGSTEGKAAATRVTFRKGKGCEPTLH
jgi:hypothetical protein